MLSQQQISENFSVAKLVLILLVATGHYFDGSILWVPVSIALFVFAFSSGYFTAYRYRGTFKISSFFLGKARRLLPSLIAINGFLLLLFIWEGRANIAHTHTFFSAFGLVGFLDWFGVKNVSPFGNGLWFFTVLLVFYGVYPFLNFICSTKNRTIFFIITLGVFCLLGQIYASPPYMLWLTVFGFGFGVFLSRVNWIPCVSKIIYLFVFLSGLFLGLNFFGFKLANVFFITILSILVASLLLVARVPSGLLGPLNCWLPCVLEIYFLHTYLFVRSPVLGVVTSYVFSIINILFLAYLINKFSNLIAQVVAKSRVGEGGCK